MIWALHGFLGEPTDWDFLSSSKITSVKTDQFSGQNLWEWASLFNTFIRDKKEKENFLLGYSLGGRMALHALLESPYLWKGAVIISSHTGLSSPEEKKKRYLMDQKWAEKFLQEGWDMLMEEWNAQPTLKNDAPIGKRQSENYSRETLSHILRSYSLGNQENLKERIEALNIPLLWVVGEKDEKYREIGQSLRFCHPHSSLHIIKGAYHRSPWTNRVYFQELVENFKKLINND